MKNKTIMKSTFVLSFIIGILLPGCASNEGKNEETYRLTPELMEKGRPIDGENYVFLRFVEREL